MGLWAIRKSGTSHLAHADQHVLIAMRCLSHLNIGAGRVVWQDIVRIDVSIKKRQFHKNEKIVESCKHAKEGNGRLHFLGLVCDMTLVRCCLINLPVGF